VEQTQTMILIYVGKGESGEKRFFSDLQSHPGTTRTTAIVCTQTWYFQLVRTIVLSTFTTRCFLKSDILKVTARGEWYVFSNTLAFPALASCEMKIKY